MKCLTLAAVAALGAMACTAAFADATASATLSDLKVTLTDLTPGDGIDPSVTFTPYNRAYSAVALTGGGPLIQQSSGADAFGDVSTAVSMSSGGAYAGIAGDAYGTGATVSVGSNAVGSHGPSSDAFVNIGGYGTLTLAPGSEVTISGLVDVFASTTNFEASAMALFNMDISADGDTSQSRRAFLWTSPYSGPYQTLEQVQEESVFLANTTSAPITALFDISLNTETLADAIPEPANATLMLAGLTALIAWRRRRA